MWFLVILGVLLATRPAVTIWPATTAPVVSSQFARLDGYGVKAEVGNVSLGCYRVTYTSHEPGKLLQLEGGVSEREVDLWEADYSFYKNRGFAVGAGLNQVDNEKLGWQVYAENNFSGLVFARLGFRRVWMGKAVDGIVAGFGIDVMKCAETFWKQEVKGKTLSQLE